MNALIEIEESVSPRVQWQRRHNLTLREYQHVHSLNKAGDRWVCCNMAMTRYASGATEDAAEQAYCERYNLPWWKLAEWNGAMEAREIVRVIEATSQLSSGIVFTLPPEIGWDIGTVALAASMEL